jgi:hypothetical protein
MRITKTRLAVIFRQSLMLAKNKQENKKRIFLCNILDELYIKRFITDSERSQIQQVIQSTIHSVCDSKTAEEWLRNGHHDYFFSSIDAFDTDYNKNCNAYKIKWIKNLIRDNDAKSRLTRSDIPYIKILGA